MEKRLVDSSAYLLNGRGSSAPADEDRREADYELDPQVMRRVLILAALVVFADTLFFSVLIPLLPQYVADLGLSRAQAGLLLGAYAWGSVVATLPAGFLAQRFGPRRVVCAGLVALSAATIVVASVTQIVVLDVARLAQGVAGAVMWSGALTWLIAAAPANRRGEVIGISVSAGGVGVVVGPPIGALAASVGTGWGFAATLMLSVPLCYFVARSPDTHEFDHQPVGEVARAILSRRVLRSVVFLAVPALSFGFVAVLLPLKASHLGGTADLLAGAFVGAGALEAILGRVSGRWSDRVGRRSPYVRGVAILCVGLTGQAATQSVGPFVSFFLLGTVGAGFLVSPGFAVVSDAAKHSALAQSHAMAVCSTVWALGLAAGSLFGGAIAGVAGLDGPYVILAVVLAVLGFYASRVLPGAPETTST